MQKQLYTKNMVYGMTYRGDCVGTGKAVILHSEIKTSKQRPLPPPSPVEREPEGNKETLMKMNRIMNMTKRMRMHGYCCCQDMMMAMK